MRYEDRNEKRMSGGPEIDRTQNIHTDIEKKQEQDTVQKQIQDRSRNQILDQTEDPAVQFMRALTDLPDDMILEAAWKEDEGAAGKEKRRWLPVFISAAAAIVIGFISWGIFSGRPRVEKSDTTETVTNGEINTERSSEEMDTGKSFEDIGKENESEAHTSSDFSTEVPSNGDSNDRQWTEGTESKVTETTEKTESPDNMDPTDTGKRTSKVDEPEKSNNGREESKKESKKEDNKKKETEKKKTGKEDNKKDETDKDETGKDETGNDETDKDEIDKDEAGEDVIEIDETNIRKKMSTKDKYEAESLILDHVDSDHSLMTDQMTGYLDLPDTFGGTVNDCGDGLLHVYATTEETAEEYKEILKEYPIVVYHSVDHSYNELREIEAMIRGHRNEFRFLKTTVEIAYNKVVVEVEAADYERMKELVQGQPVLVRIYGTDEQSLQDVSEIPEMNAVSDNKE